MTDKEQIIIHEIDVSKCKYHNNGWCELPESIDDARNKPCGDMTLFDCYFKQLTRKMQECEELKDYARRQENQRETYYKEFLKKDKALEEIENNINKYFEESFYKNCRYAKGCTSACGLATNRVFNQILDIINKVKGEK